MTNYTQKSVSGSNSKLHEAVAVVVAAAEAGDAGGQRLQNMVDSLLGESSAFLLDKWLVDSGADLNICFNYELFSYIGPSDIDMCTPIGSTPLDVLGRGVVKMCVGHYVDHNGLSHPIDLEIEMCTASPNAQ